MTNTLNEQLGKLNQRLRSQVYGTLFGITAMFPPRESFGEGRSEAVVLDDERRTFGYREQPQIVQFPPEPKVPDTVFSDVYQAEVPRDLYEAGIERLDVEAGKAVLSMSRIIGSTIELQRDAAGYCGLDLQDRIMGMYAGLGEHLDKVGNSALVSLDGDNPIVKLVLDAQGKYEATVGRKSNLDTLIEESPNDPMAVASRYYG